MYQEKIMTKHQTFNSEDQLGKLQEEKLNEDSQAITKIVWYHFFRKTVLDPGAHRPELHS